ncbi:MAG: DeoR/GlpR family DNA-binding transcription regulator [Bacteroidales bacterium]|nr:DeoR/GlpR family DNA-binding transcription regulator [Bacteroidales bacterium]
MLSIAERHNYILEKLAKQGYVRITDIAEELGVTKVTIRSDFKVLEDKGMLYRMRGSARPANPHVADLRVSVKEQMNHDAKQKIARRAVEYLEANDSIFIGDGSTAYAFAEEIRNCQFRHLNIVTPFLRIGILFNDMDDVNVIQLGGTVHKESLSVLGEQASKTLEYYMCSKVFFGVDGIDIENGVTTSTIEGARLTRKMMDIASQSILLADSSKFGKRGFGFISSIEDIDVIITDSGVPEHVIPALNDAGVDLIIAE